MNKLRALTTTLLSIYFLNIYKSQIIKLNAPYKFLGVWEKKRIEDLRCPTRPLNYLDIDKVTSLDSFTFGFKAKRLAEGYFCIKKRLITRCYENFFGVQSVDQWEITLKVTPSECRDGQFNYENGGKKHYVYPPANCKWLATREVFLNYIDIIPRKLPFDVYRNGIVDSRFINGICQDKICEDLKLRGFWIFTSKDSNFCGIKEKLKAYVYKDELDSHLFTNFAYNRLLSQSCRIMICGMNGIRFNDGKWIAYGDSSVKECDKNETIFEYNIKGEILIEEIKLEESILHFECKRMLKESIKNRKADVDLLKILTPLTPGLYYTQRLMGLDSPYIEERKGFFEIVSLFKNKTFNGCIGYSKNNPCISHSDYYSSSSYGPMGLHTSNGKLIYNPDDLHKLYRETTEEKESNIIEIGREEGSKNDKTENNSTDYVDSIIGKTIYSLSVALRKISDFFNGIFNNLIYTSLLFSGILLLCFIIYLILRKRLRDCFRKQLRKNYYQNNLDHLELSNRNLM